MKEALILVPLLFHALALSVSSQNDWHTYPERKLFDFISQEKKLVYSAPADMHISAKPFPAKTLVVYTGKKRPVGKYAKHFINIWVQSLNVPPENAELLAEEHLFKEGNRELWMPVHKVIAAALEQTVQPGEEILIYYFYLGGFNPKKLQSKDSTRDRSALPEMDELRWMLAVEEFEKPRSTAFTPQPLDKAIDRSMESPGRILDVWLDPRKVKIRATLAFTGDVRPVSDRRQRLLDLWFEDNGFPGRATALMSDEARFLDGEKEYWIAVQNSFLKELRKTKKKGELVSLNIILAGGIRTGDAIDWFFLTGGVAQ